MLNKLINTLMIIGACAFWLASVSLCFAQDFPYMVPEAPEFESPGAIGKAPSPSAPAEQKKAFQPSPGGFKPKFEAGPLTPSRVPEAPLSNNEYYVPPTPSPATRTGPVRGPSVESQPTPQSMPPQRPVASMPPQGAGTGTRPQTDCSEFPMLIARSRSDTEMQMTARHYLTCLMQGGWTMEQARDQVIRTIETAYRPGR